MYLCYSDWLDVGHQPEFPIFQRWLKPADYIRFDYLPIASVHKRTHTHILVTKTFQCGKFSNDLV